MNSFPKFQLYSFMAFKEMIFFCFCCLLLLLLFLLFFFFFFFFANLDFWLPWQPIKFRGFDKNCMLGTGLLAEHFCKTFVKISAVG